MTLILLPFTEEPVSIFQMIIWAELVNDLRGGLSYSYFLQAGRDLYINAGLSASFFHRGFNFSDAVFPDQIDPMGGISANFRIDVK